MIRVMVVEDQRMLRDSLVAAISEEPDMTVVAALADASDALEMAQKTEPDLVLMDVCTEGGASGIVAGRAIKRGVQDTRVVIMTGMPEVSFVRQAKDAGVDSFVYKNVGTRELLAVLRSTLGGYSTFPARRKDTFFGAMELSDEEIQILRLACEAKSRQEIADALFISEGTVKRRISDLLAKTGYDNLLKLAVQAVSNGYIVPGLEYLPE